MIGRLILATMALAVPTTGASAATIVQNFSLGGPGSVLTATAFDPSLGILNSVQFSFESNVTYNWSAFDGVVDTLVDFEIDADLSAADFSFVEFFSEYQTAFIFASLGPLESSSGSELLSVSGGSFYTDPTILGSFLASVGDPSFTYAFTMFDDRFRNEVTSFSGSFGRTSGTASLTYDYTPNILPVPEPASWAMMIAGFGLTGAAMRRRRMVPVAA